MYPEKGNNGVMKKSSPQWKRRSTIQHQPVGEEKEVETNGSNRNSKLRTALFQL